MNKCLKRSILCGIFTLLFLFNINVFATVSNKNFVNVNVPAAVVIDSDTNRVLFEKNADEKRPMASLTKLMTSILLVENCKMDELIEVPKEAVWIGGSEVGLKKGDKVSAKSLLYGMLLPSGNDCAYTVGIHLSGTIEEFSKLMNEKAKKMVLENTNFINPHGLDNPNHYTTAKEMAKITSYALNNQYINEAVKTKSITINFGSFSKLLNNTNALLSTYPLADGAKTGFTNGANRCLAASATNGNSRYIAVVLGADTTKIRFNTARQLLDESFTKYKKMDISKYLKTYINIPVIKGNISYYEKQYEALLEIPLTQEEYDSIYIKQNMVEKIDAPMTAGTKIGTFEVYIEEELLYKKDIILEEDIVKKNILDYMVDGIKNMFIPVNEI